MFAIFLFIVVFSFYCCIYNDIQQNSVKSITTKPSSYNLVITAKPRVKLPTATIAPQQSEIILGALQNIVPEAIESLPICERQTNAIPRTIVAESLVLEQITSLKLREARIVAKRLEITQKVNGKDKSLDWLQREIRQKLTNDRTLVIEVLQQLMVS